MVVSWEGMVGNKERGGEREKKGMPGVLSLYWGELWNEVHEIVQETGIKTIPMEKKCKKANDWLGGYKNKTNICFLHKKPSPRKRKAKWLSEEALQIAEKRREAKGK